MKKITFAFAALAAAALTMPAAAQNNVYDFEGGTLEGFQSITRPDTYNDEPTVVTSSTEFPGAFPLPSGTNALSVADSDENSFGLASAIGGTVFSRADAGFTSATLSADIYVVSSASGTEGNVALLAINDGTLTTNEAYYRFGYRNDEVFLQKWDGGVFSTLGQDANLDDTNMTIPGWNTFTIQFVGSETINFSVNGTAPSFSPVTEAESTIDEEIQVGVLGFNISSFNAILADNISEEIVQSSSVEDWMNY